MYDKYLPTADLTRPEREMIAKAGARAEAETEEVEGGAELHDPKRGKSE
jgi:hypothetical protein